MPLSRAMVYRAPDHEALWSGNGVALGCRMLRTTPESVGETLPFADVATGIVITADARLDNRAELGDRLGINEANCPDSQLILAAYLRWGRECVRYLLGDFVFAIWDPVIGEMYCVRDPLGARSLSYVVGSGFFAFATEAAALTCLPGVGASLNDDMMALLLVPELENTIGNQSWYSGIRFLESGSALRVDRSGKVREEKYWRLEPGAELQFTSDEECQEAFIDIFGKAVSARLRSHSKPAFMVSGGLDTAGIAAMIQRLGMGDGAVATFSAIADHLEGCVESRNILSLSVRKCFSPHYLNVPSFTGMLGIEDLVETAWGRAHPMDNSVLVPALMARAAAGQGHNMMIHGVTGDFAQRSSYWYLVPLLRRGQIITAIREAFEAWDHHTRWYGHSSLRYLAVSAYKAFAPEFVKHSIRRSRPRSPVNLELINPDFAAKMGIREKIDALRDARIGSRELSEQASFVQCLDQVTNGLSLYNRVGGRVGVEMRDPWADERVLAFFLHLPARFRVRNGWTKHLVRTAFHQELDEGVRWRRGKEHLGYHCYQTLMGTSKDFVARVIREDLSWIESYVDRNLITSWLNSYIIGGDTTRLLELFEIATLILWIRNCTEKKA